MYELNGKELCGERVILEFSRKLPARRGGYGGYDRRPPPRMSRSYFSTYSLIHVKFDLYYD